MLKKNIRVFVIILIILIVVVSSTYAYFYLNASNNTVSGDGGCFVVSYSGNTVLDGNLSVVSNYIDGAHLVVNLSKNSNCKIYTEASIYLHINNDSEIPFSSGVSGSDAFKYTIVNNSSVIASGVVSNNGSDNILLSTVQLTDVVKSYDVYLWVDSNLSQGVYDGKSFSGYIYAESSQTSTLVN